MTTAESKALYPHPCCNTQRQAILALVRTMLDTIVQCHEAVLQDDSETLTVIGHVARWVLMANPALASATPSAADLEGNVKALLVFAVRTHEQPLAERSLVAYPAPSATACTLDDSSGHDLEVTVSNWFFTLSFELNAAHPQAAQMLRARLAGLDCRQIADRLQVPPRLV